MGSVGALAVAPAASTVAYDPKKDLASITMGMVFPLVFAVHPASPTRTLREFVTLAKQRPGELTYGTAGVGTTNHLAAALFSKRAGIELTHIPYKGAGPATTDALGGRLSLLSAQLPNAKPQVDAGKLIALATTGAARSPLMPDVPTVAELGFPGYEVTTWYAFFASSKVPAAILDYWNREIGKVLRDPVVGAELAKQGFEPVPGTREELARYLAAEIDLWGKVVRENKIRLE
jgi:tripartite-type tricarboxylate transporter receptor subunit TctC